MNSLIVENISLEERVDLSGCRIPHHIAIIMDGNRRWAKQHHLPCMVGHWKGAEALTHIVRAAAKLGVKVLTVYSFSTENWVRGSEEVQALMHLFKVYLERQKEFMVQEGVRLSAIGNLARLPPSVRTALDTCKEATKNGQEIDLVLALNYGGRDDIRRACLSMIADCEAGALTKEAISEELFSRYLDTAAWPDPQLLIRTSGEKRLSNFLLWQLSYAEVYVTDVLWPDFTEKDLLGAVREYQQRERRLGG
jgi:undecaprenyl diphosphate synthase